MFKLIQFEMKKIVRSAFFRLLMVVLLLFFLGYYVFVYINTDRAADEIRKMEDEIQRQEQWIEEYERDLESAEGAEAREIQNTIEFWENWKADDEATLELYKQEDWPAVLQQEIEQEEPTIGTMKYNNETHTYTWPTLFTVETYVAMNEWLRDKEITPLFPLNSLYWSTYYDQAMNIEGASEEEGLADLKARTEKYSSTSTHYLYHLFGLLFTVFGTIFFLFLFGDVVTKEGLGRYGPIHLLRTQPIHRDKILISKLLTVLLFSFFILLVTIGLALLTGIIFDRIGSWEYPILIYGEDRSFTLMSMGTFLMKAIGMFMMILLFCYSILFLFSMMTKRVLIAIGLTLGTLLIGVRLSEEVITSSLAHFIPFQYFSVFEILTNEFAVSLDNFHFNFTNGMISLGVASFIILLVTYVVSVRQYRNSSN